MSNSTNYNDHKPPPHDKQSDKSTRNQHIGGLLISMEHICTLSLAQQFTTTYNTAVFNPLGMQ